MPIPIWYISFRKLAGRDPRPEEIDDEQRRSLLECAEENQRNGCHSAQDVERLRWLAREPELAKGVKAMVTTEKENDGETATRPWASVNTCVAGVDLVVSFMKDGRTTHGKMLSLTWDDVVSLVEARGKPLPTDVVEVFDGAAERMPRRGG